MHVNQCAYIGPVVQPLRIRGRSVHAAMAHGMAKVVMPIRTVNTVAFIEVHYIGHIGQVIARAAHGLGEILHIDVILPGDGGRAR